MLKEPEVIVEELLQKIEEHNKRIEQGDVDYLLSEETLHYVNPYSLEQLAPRLRSAARAVKDA